MLLDQVDTLHDVRFWSEVLCCTSKTHLGDLKVNRSQTYKFCVKFLVKVLISLFVLNMWMDQVDTLYVDRYWSDFILCHYDPPR